MGKLTTHQRKARDLMQRENWDGALAELQRVLGVDANNPTLHNQIGDVYLRKGAIEQACDHFEMAVDLYSNLSLHNNAVALCRKVVRLAPTRVEVRYHLARLRMDQGLRSDAAAAFIDYLEHANPADDAAADALEQRCVEIVESFPDLAPVGQIVEKLETVQRPQGAYKIVQRAAQRATDAGDTAAATRLTEKMRSLRVLLEGQGSKAPDEKQVPQDPLAVELSSDIPDVDLSHNQGDPAAVRSAPAAKANMVDPGAIDLPAPRALQNGEESASIAQSVALPALDPASVEEDVAEDENAESSIPEIDLDDVGSLDDAVAELQGVLSQVDPEAPPEGVPGAFDLNGEVDPVSVDDLMMPEYELPETSLEEVASLLEQEGLEPTSDLGVEDIVAFTAPADARQAADFLLPEEVDPAAVDFVAPEVAAFGATPPLLRPEEEEPEPENADWLHSRPAAATSPSNGSLREVASIADTFADPPSGDIQDDVDSGMIPQMHPDDRPASVVYEPAPVSRRPGATDEMRRAPVWIPSPNAVSQDPDPSEEGQVQELEEVIDTFREQMARALGDDGAARYDLGVAYYEMGLYNEALAEFEVAVKCPGLSARTLEMMSSCLSQQGRHDEVVSLLQGPLSEPGETTPEDRLSLQYAMGLALEAVGQQDDARSHFEEVALVDIGFKDVQSRLQR